ncbi:MAG: hypothetical protein AAGC55_06675, partial [Myxococcota bacterium]
LMLSLSLSLGVAACGDDGSGGDAITLNPVTGTFVGPESAHWDATNNVWYVANLGQSGIGAPDQPCYITRIAADGTVMDERFVEIAEGDFVGTATMNGMLYVTHSGVNLVEIDPADPSNPTIIPVPDTMFINDVAAGDGTLYMSDTLANTIYRYTPGGEFETLSEDPALVAPNGVYVDGDEVIVGTLGAFPVDPDNQGGMFSIDAAGVATRIGTLEGAFDGIEKDGERYLVSDFDGTISLLSPSGDAETVADFSQEPYSLVSVADIGFDPTSRTVMVPDLNGNSVAWFVLP